MSAITTNDASISEDEGEGEGETPQVQAQDLQPELRRWAQNRASAEMRSEPVEVFYAQGGDWFYVGQFKAYALPDMTVEEFKALDSRV